MEKLKLVCFLLIFVFINVNFAQEIKPVELAGTQVLTIHSSIVNQDYDLYLNFPRFFDDTTRSFPVVYLLDAQWDFALLNAIYGEQYYDGFLPEAIIVGITWGGINPNPDILRRRDFTPTLDGQQPVGGGADKFIAFLKKELIPFIDSTFRTKTNDRTLMGSSLGGLFTLYALFNETGLFNRYVLTSPAIGWDNGIISSYENKYSEEGADIPVKLSMAVGEYENVNYFQTFVDKLRDKNYKGLQLNSFVIDGIGHSGGKAEGYTRGLQYVFKRNDVSVETDILKKYAGAYENTFGYMINLRLENDHLVADLPGETNKILYASINGEYYIKGQYFNIHFQSDEAGKTKGFQLETYSNNFFMKRVN